MGGTNSTGDGMAFLGLAALKPGVVDTDDSLSRDRWQELQPDTQALVKYDAARPIRCSRTTEKTKATDRPSTTTGSLQGQVSNSSAGKGLWYSTHMTSPMLSSV